MIAVAVAALVAGPATSALASQGPTGQGPTGQGGSGQGPTSQGPAGQGGTGQGAAGEDGAATHGFATHFAPTPQGNCSYPNPPADGLYVALSPGEYANGAACGEYLDVSGPGGKTVRVEVTDQCPACGHGHLDLSEQAFSRLSALPVGLIGVSYRTVTNPPLTAPVAVRVKEGSSANWLALLPMNTGNALSSVQVQNSSGGWDSLTRSGYGYWIAQQGEGPGPFTVRLTDTAGHTVTIGGVALSPGATDSTSTWMYGTGTTPALPSASPAPSGSPVPQAGSPSAAPPSGGLFSLVPGGVNPGGPMIKA